ncbi:CotH kinase family protein [Hymenobacter sp. NST-14]|uniref:CotH kinase family protein n=1 Tax=Hymenobacter piscis TaxID=2839984 RepID=UPI001C00D293|nr:CotH kinase family protein [Hymenobacter piscis]MBT9392967.1 CotH kinase family protein [Hymenobacter piscis]
MSSFFTRTLLLWLCMLVGFAPAALADDTLTIAPPFYHVDHQQRLVLINQRPADLPVSTRQTRRYLRLDHTYALAAPLTAVATDSVYQARYADTTYAVYFTQLPVVRLTTRHVIADTPSVYARLQLTEPDGLVIESALGIEIRGGFSQTYPKKSYELSFWHDSTGQQSADVQLLGMRTDNKYNLQALYNEPLRIRSKTANALWQEVHQIYYKAAEPEAKNGISMEYAEVFLNGRYLGLYALTERIDRKQLKLKKYNQGITGELYKGAGWGGSTFTARPPFDNTSEIWSGFEYKHPDEQIDWTALHRFVGFVLNSPDEEFYRTYQQQFHLDNAVDYFIFLNLLRAGDNTGKNLYIAKYKQGEPYYYVPWDLDGVFGTDWTGTHTGATDGILSNGLYDRLLNDCAPDGFRDRLRARWAALRRTVLTQQHLLDLLQANSATLRRNNVYAREQLAWPAFRPSAAQMPYIATWLTARLQLLDDTFAAPCSPVTATTAPQTARLQLYPNPATNYLTVEIPAGPYALSIRDLSGRMVLQTVVRGPQSQVAVGHLTRGVYVATVQGQATVQTARLLLR